MDLDLRLVKYFVAVAQAGNVTRAAERLHISQPALSAAVKQLEQQLGVALLERVGRGLRLTPAGELLLARGLELLEHAGAVADEVRGRGADEPAARLRIGLSPTARYGVAPALLAACAAAAPAVMLYASEDTTAALLRDVAHGRLDLAVVFCAPSDLPDGVELELLRDEQAVIHLPAGHPLAERPALTLDDLADETILIAGGRESGGFTDRVLRAFAAAGLKPRTAPDPYPDLGLRAVREGVGVVVYVRGAFPPQLPGSAFVSLDPPLPLPFHLAWRASARTRALEAVLDAVRAATSLGA
ncbi:MAG TPA: LysR family transcriptional regulator [Solirubrobacteraceae bacterium]|jgi:DNA-binding transcriptional LysR family regulator|nr:LysR family transcriptional regulator [Solirubrobacteraceae bacterium]